MKLILQLSIFAMAIFGYIDSNAQEPKSDSNELIIQEMTKADESGNFTKVIALAKTIPEDPMAQYVVAIYTLHGKGTRQDFHEAVKWMKKSAAQGFAAAQYDLGVMYYNGDGVELNTTEAINWYIKAAEQGHVSAQFNLAYIYTNGDMIAHIAPDYVKARKWAKMAADQGNSDAQYLLDYCIPAE